MKRLPRGFTLIELLVAITIIGILISVATVAFSNARAEGRDGRRRQDLNSLVTAEKLYFQDNGKYACFAADASTCGVASTATALTALVSNNYIKQLPVDPGTLPNAPCDYFVSFNATGTAYTIFIILEDTNSSDAKSVKPAPLVPPFASGAFDGGATWRMPPYHGGGDGYILPPGGGAICAGLPYGYNYWVNSD